MIGKRNPETTVWITPMAPSVNPQTDADVTAPPAMVTARKYAGSRTFMNPKISPVVSSAMRMLAKKLAARKVCTQIQIT